MGNCECKPRSRSESVTTKMTDELRNPTQIQNDMQFFLVYDAWFKSKDHDSVET